MHSIMSKDIGQLRFEVATLLACARTRINKDRWMSIQGLLQQSGETGPPGWCGLGPQFLRERDYLRTIIENSSRMDTAIMTCKRL